MAEAIVSLLIEHLGTLKLLDEVKQVKLVRGVRDEIDKLTQTLLVIKAMIKEAERRKIHEEAVNLWLENLEEVFYDMEDFLDEWITETKIRAQVPEARVADHDSYADQDKTNHKKKVSSLSSFKTIPLRHDIESKIQEIRKGSELIEDYIVKFQSIPNPVNRINDSRLNTTSIIDVEDICGRDHDEKTILDRLLGIHESSTSNTNRVPQIISIVGMGGVGKTTLAQKVFNHDKVKTYFEKTMWVCVSSPFDITKVAKSIIQEAGGESTTQDCSEWNNHLHNSLCASLERKRYLLVLDDVWNEDASKWDPLNLSLKRGSLESRTLVTTRSRIVSDIIGATYQHSLGELSDDDCCSLVSRIAFQDRKQEECDELRDICNQLAEKCKGLPLAAKSLGSLLRFKKTKNEWLGLLGSNIWDLDHKGAEYLKPALLLSYNDLSPPLKNCFQYCVTIPKNNLIRKDKLIKSWMAHGYLNSSSSSGSSEDDLESVGESYFVDLAKRSFFQNFVKKNDGTIEHCEMHDIVHDLAQFLMKNKFLTVEEDNHELLNMDRDIHHLSLFGAFEKFLVPSVCKFKKLRTLVTFLGPSYWPDYTFGRYLRVLSLEHSELKNIPSEIEKLVHLRCLDLSYNYKLKGLPDSLCNLYNLQTLELSNCSLLGQLPKGVGRLVNLRHLGIQDLPRLRCLPEGIGKLKCLRSLTKFALGTGTEGCKIKELKDLNFLRGKLVVEMPDKLENLNEVSEAEMNKKKHLISLSFKFSERYEEGNPKVEEMLRELQPHSNLEELSIESYSGLKFPSWIGSGSVLPNLRSLVLHRCMKCIELPATLGLLPSLEYLRIYEAEKLKHLRSGTQQQVAKTILFPKLKILSCERVELLEELDLVGVLEKEEQRNGSQQQPRQMEIITIMPCLEKIHISSLNKLKVMVVNKHSSLQEIHIRGVDEMVVFNYQFTSCLQILQLDSCKMLKSLSDHQQLREMYITNCPSLFEIPMVLPNLASLDITNCPLISQFPILPNLASLNITKCPSLFEIPILPNLTSFSINKCESISQLPILPNLASLSINKCRSISKLPSLPNLTFLSVFNCPSLSQLPILPNLKSLTCSAYKNNQLSLPRGISQLKQLQTLRIGYYDSLTRIPHFIHDLTNLQELYISSNSLRKKQHWREGEDWNIISHIREITINDWQSEYDE